MSGPPSVHPGGLERLTPWLTALAAALLVAGPALGPGLLLNLDLVVTADPPVPTGLWGLGPELPRGVPFQVPVAWLSALLDGALVAKGLMVAVIVVAFVGTYRLARGAPTLARLAAGLVYAAGPFLVTRLAIGHLGTALAAALLPWALPTLLRPSDAVRRTLVWSAALGFCGINGGILLAAAVAVGLVAERGRRAGPVLAAAFVGQLPWLVPGLVVGLQGIDPAGADAFDTRLAGPLGLLRLAAGQGYFIADFDVGGERLVVPLAAAAVVVAAAVGWRRLPPGWGPRAVALGALGFAVAAASGIPGVAAAYQLLADTPVGLPLREGHRVLPLFLVVLAPAAAHGWGRLQERFDGAGLFGLGVAVLVASPSLWGFGGQLQPVDAPEEWDQARRLVHDEPGPVLALPWGQYLRPRFLDHRLVHQPLPYVFGGDVLVASGRGEPGGPVERADERLPAADDLAARLRDGEPAADQLAALGVRWVALLASADNQYDDLGSRPDLRAEVVGPTLTLYRVRDLPDEAVEVDPVIGPLARADGDAGTWYRPGAWGWLRGLEATSVTSDGNLALPDAAGPVWYWPSLLVLAADGVTVGALWWARPRHR